jgi:hypothetical protein
VTALDLSFADSYSILSYLSKVANMPAMLDSYHRIVAAAKNQATWLLLIDSDEFMYAASPSANVATTLKALVAKHPLAGQV